jgi:hypothetical protein
MTIVELFVRLAGGIARDRQPPALRFAKRGMCWWAESGSSLTSGRAVAETVALSSAP